MNTINCQLKEKVKNLPDNFDDQTISRLEENIESLKNERVQLNNKLESIEKTFKDINGRCITAEQEKEQVKIFLIHFKFLNRFDFFSKFLEPYSCSRLFRTA